MNRIISVLMVLLFLSGCALSTVKSPKKGASAPAREAVTEEAEEEVYTPSPSLLSTTSNEKEEVAPVKEKEEVLPLGSTASEEIK